MSSCGFKHLIGVYVCLTPRWQHPQQRLEVNQFQLLRDAHNVLRWWGLEVHKSASRHYSPVTSNGKETQQTAKYTLAHSEQANVKTILLSLNSSFRVLGLPKDMNKWIQTCAQVFRLHFQRSSKNGSNKRAEGCRMTLCNRLNTTTVEQITVCNDTMETNQRRRTQVTPAFITILDFSSNLMNFNGHMWAIDHNKSSWQSWTLW